jgi:hypothetical protein
VVEVHHVEEDGAVERLGVRRDVREDLLERGSVRELANGEAAEKQTE